MDLAYRVYKNILLSMWEITLSQLLFFYASLVLFLLVFFYVYRKYIFIVLQPVDFSISFVLYFLPRYEHWYCSLQQIFQLSFMLFCQFRWRHVHMYCSFQQIFHLSIVLFPQSRWRHMYCSFQQIFNCLLCCFIILYEDICTVASNGYFICLLCCFLNPDEDICTVPSNRYSMVCCVVLSIQMKTYVLFLPTDIQLSIVLFPQSRWRHMYCSFQQIFNCLLCCSLNPDEDICTFPSNRYSIVYCVVSSIQMKIYVLFLPWGIQLSITCMLFYHSIWGYLYYCF